MRESLAFWQALEFEKIYDEHEVWKDQRLHVIKLKCKQSDDVIELVDGNWPNHIAVTVDKLPSSKFTQKRPTGHKVMFIMSPEGTRIELVEEPE